MRRILPKITFTIMFFASTIYVQAKSFNLEVSSKKEECYTRGEISVNIPDLQISEVQNVRYILTSTRPDFSTLEKTGDNTLTYTFDRLRGSSIYAYSLKVIVTFTDNTENENYVSPIYVASTYMEPSIVIDGTPTPSVRCLDTGYVSFYFLGGRDGGTDDNFKYSIKKGSTPIVTEAPAGSYSYNPANKYTQIGLEAGDYTIEVFDECNYSIINTPFTIGQTDGVLSDNVFSNRFYKTGGAYSCSGLSVKINEITDPNDQYYNYWGTRHLYYEYLWVNEVETSLPSSGWQSFIAPGLPGSTEIVVPDSKFSQNYAYYIDNPNRRPKLLVRLRNASDTDCYKAYSFSLDKYELQTSIHSYDCTSKTYVATIVLGGSLIGCGDVTLTINWNDPIEGPQSKTVEYDHITGNGLSFTDLMGRVRDNFKTEIVYNLTAVDEGGLTVTTALELQDIDFQDAMRVRAYYEDPCVSDEGMINIYSNIDKFLLENMEIELLESPGDIIPPIFDPVTKKYTFPDTYKYSDFYLFGRNVEDNTPDPRSSSPYPIPAGKYKILFDTNSKCGSPQIMEFDYEGGTPYVVNDFTLEDLKNCSGKKLIINKNTENLITQGNYSRTAFLKVVKKGSFDSDNSILYFDKDGNSVLDEYLTIEPDEWEDRGYVLFQVPGEYTIRVSALQSFSSDYECAYKEKNLIISINNFGLDEINSGSYVCAGTIKVTAKAKDGGYEELDNNSPPGKLYHQNYRYKLYANEEAMQSAYRFLNGTGTSSDTDDYVMTSPIVTNGAAYTFSVDDTHPKYEEIVNNSVAYVLLIDESCSESQRMFQAQIPLLREDEEFELKATAQNVCIGETITIHVSPSLGDGTVYLWKKDNVVLSTGGNIDIDGSILTISEATLDNAGIYEVVVEICGEDKTAKIAINIAPSVMIWSDNAISDNWNEPQNWRVGYDWRKGNGEATPGMESYPAGTLISAIPAECTTVHIPSNAGIYPDLLTNYDISAPPVCDAIIFHFGGEVNNTHLLKYNKAYVEYNWGYYPRVSENSENLNYSEVTNWETTFPSSGPGSTNTGVSMMQRDRWYMLSAPLMSTASGDFNVGGYPVTYQRLFNVSNPMSGVLTTGTFTTPFNNTGLDLKYHTNGALAVAIAPYEASRINMRNHIEMTRLDGKFRMPYIDDPEMLDGKGHKNNKHVNGITRLGYYWSNNLEPIPGDYDEIIRDMNEGANIESNPSRFVFEDNTGKIRIINGVRGYSIYISDNPDDGSGYGDTGEIMIMVGNPYMAHIDFDKFAVANENLIEPVYYLFENTQWNLYEKEGIANTTDRYIAPLQAFIVKLKEGVTSGTLFFPVEGSNAITIANVSSKLKSKKENLTINSLTIDIANSKGKTKAAIVWNQAGRNSVPLLHNSSYKEIPQIFIVGEDFMYNTIQYEQHERKEIPLGIYSGYPGQTSLHFTFDETLKASGSKIILLDKHNENVEQNLLENPYFVYNHTNEMEEDRFVLKISENTTANPSIESSYCYLNYHQNLLRINASANIDKINIIGAQGVLVKKVMNINKQTYSENLVLLRGVYIAFVELSNGIKKTEKIIVN